MAKRYCPVVPVGIMVAAFAPGGVLASGDYDKNGFVDYRDYPLFEPCLSAAGPRQPGAQGCVDGFDRDGDADVDLADWAALSRRGYHLPMPLRDSLGNLITVGSSAPYSGRQTCGLSGCHDADRVSSGAWFQDGRTDSAGSLDMQDDYYGDGRHWIKSAGRYGKWGQSFQFLLAAKDNQRPSDMDQTTFAWVRDCSGCHPGGGPGEFDRDGMILYDASTGEFGYEGLGLTPADVTVDGDYSVLDYASGTTRLAPWDVTGLSGPDCLKCHRTQRAIVNGVDMNLVWRKNILATGERLVDAMGNPVPAFAAAGTAGQGWFSMLDLGASATASVSPVGGLNPVEAAFLGLDAPGLTASAGSPVLQIDYSVGVADGSLVVESGGVVALALESVTRPPKDQACWGCHPYGTITGTVWFDDRDIHYRKFNRLNDGAPSNDIPPEESRVCTYCHPGNLDHNIAKGNSPQLEYRDDLDWVGFRTCRDCHLTHQPDGTPNPLKHPEAPDVPGNTLIHNVGFGEGHGPMEVLSCQACHIPYALVPAVVFRDITVPGSVGTTTQYYSADPLDPTNPDKSTWFPSLINKTDVDGIERWFPANVWITIYFGDWNRNGTPEDLTDDVIAPIPTWRVAQVVGSVPTPVDDDGDGRPEINHPSEVFAYLQALKNNDANGVAVAENPVIVRGRWVWHEDAAAPGGVGSFEHVGAGIAMDAWYPYVWGMDHNVLAAEESWGYHPTDPSEGCKQCHQPDTLDSPVFDRLVLVDPFDANGQPVYRSVRELTGLNPP